MERSFVDFFFSLHDTEISKTKMKKIKLSKGILTL